MAEPFCSVYTKDYQWVPLDEVPENPPPCEFIDPEANFLPEKDSKIIYDPARDDEILRRLRRNRLQSTYRVSYRDPACRRGRTTNPFEDEFMNHFNRVYAEKTQAVLRPPATSRTIYGYTRFDLYYTGQSEYQADIGYEAYKRFKRDFDRGISRLFRKKPETVIVAPEKEEEKKRPCPKKKEEERKKKKKKGGSSGKGGSGGSDQTPKNEKKVGPGGSSGDGSKGTKGSEGSGEKAAAEDRFAHKKVGPGGSEGND